MTLLTPQQLRERLVRYYEGAYRRFYGGADRASIERKVIAQLEYVDAAKRAAPPRAPSKRRASAPKRAPDAARSQGLEVRQERGQIYRPAFLHKNPWHISERWAAATARITRILQGAHASTLVNAIKSSEVPRLAKKFLDVYAAYMLRGRPAPITGVDHNPFRGLSDKDAARMFMRKVEDICDESTRELGGWYVK